MCNSILLAAIVSALALGGSAAKKAERAEQASEAAKIGGLSYTWSDRRIMLAGYSWSSRATFVEGSSES